MTIFIQSPVSLRSDDTAARDVRSREQLPDRPLVEEYKARAKSGQSGFHIEKFSKYQLQTLTHPGKVGSTA
jgi:hypothetical protein